METEVHIDEVLHMAVPMDADLPTYAEESMITDSPAVTNVDAVVDQQENIDDADYSRIEFMGFGAAQVVCAVEGVMKCKGSLKVERRCVRV